MIRFKLIICNVIALLVLFFVLDSCSSESNNSTIPYVSYSEDDDEYIDDDISSDIVSVPYFERNGVKYIRVSLNGVEVDMIFDTGCSSTLISIAEAQYLYAKGLITEDDILGYSKSTIADGSIVENMVINLNQIVIADKLSCENVKAVVSLNNDAPLLLGNEVLNRAASYVIDNENGVIRFKLN